MNTKPSHPFSIFTLILLTLVCLAPKLHADDLPPVVHILSIDGDAAEAGSDPATFLVIRIGPTNQPLTVYYDVGGSASNGVDYAPLCGSVTIPGGSFFAPVTVTPVDDDAIEGTESVIVGLHQPLEWPPPYIVLWPSIALAEIEDNDFPPTNQPPSVAIVSPPAGATFEAPLDLPIVAKATDLDGRVRTVEFFGDGVSLGIVTNRPTPFPVAAILDPLLDLDPSTYPDLDVTAQTDSIPIPGALFRLVWSNVPPGLHTLTALATDNQNASTTSAPVLIKVLEIPPQPVVDVRATDPEATEPCPTCDHVDTATFTIHRTGNLDFPLTVYYRLGGTASNGIDYRELPFNAIIPRGERTVDVVIEPIDDTLVEGAESVLIKLLPPVCVEVFPPPPDCYLVGRCDTARAVIHDNDTNLPPLVRIVRPLEGSIFLAPADVLIAAEARDLDGRVVTVEFFEGTNSLGIVTNAPFSVTNSRPPFFIVWSNVPPGRYVLSAEATDNQGDTSRSKPVEIKVVPHLEVPIVSIQATDPIASEPGPTSTIIDTATFEVTRTGDTSNPLLVYYGISGTASNGVDYRMLSGKLVIPAGAAKTNIVVIPLDDNLIEGTETVGITITPGLCLATSPLPPDCYVPGTNNHARAIIRDNDFPPTNQPPKIEIVKPEDGDLFRAFSDISIYARALDIDGFVRTVEFFQGTNSLGIVTNGLSPIVIGSDVVPDPEQIFRLVWSNAPPGGYVLTARATDNQGASSLSAPVHIRVAEPPLPPVVTIYATDPIASEGDLIDIAPVDNSSPDSLRFALPNPGRFTIARSCGTNVDLVVYYSLSGTASNGVDYLPLSGKTLIPRGQWKTDIQVIPIDDKLVEGTESVSAKLLPVPCAQVIPVPTNCYRVGDPDGAVVFIRDNDFNLSPRVTLVEPANGSIFCAPADIKIEAVARDPDGYVGKVEFFAGTNLIGVDEIFFIVPPPPGQLQSFSILWTNVPVGNYILRARATDNLGAMTISEPIRIAVVQKPPVPVVTIVATDRVGSEQDPRLAIPLDIAIFKVSRYGDLGQPLKVFYRIGGTASNGVDYAKLSGEVLIPQNESAAPIIVAPIDDHLVEGTESVVIELLQPDCLLSNASPLPGCYLVGQPRRDVVYIKDNDSIPNQFPRVAILNPPDGSVFDSPANIRLVAAADDPDGWVATVEFFAGTNSLGIVTNHPWLLDPVGVLDLKASLPTEISPINPFVLLWSNAPPGHFILTAVATDNLGASTRSAPIEITILGPNIIPLVNIIATDALAREGTDNTASFRIRRRGATNDPLTVFYLIRGTASNGVDYVAIPNSLTIPAGRRSARIIITPIDDKIAENVETVILRLLPPPTTPLSYLIGRPARAGAVILDNDCPLPGTQLLADSCLHVRLPLTVGEGCRWEASSDLINWETLFVNLVSDAQSGFVDDETSLASRFYRVVTEAVVLGDE